MHIIYSNIYSPRLAPAKRSGTETKPVAAPSPAEPAARLARKREGQGSYWRPESNTVGLNFQENVHKLDTG